MIEKSIWQQLNNITDDVIINNKFEKLKESKVTNKKNEFNIIQKIISSLSEEELNQIGEPSINDLPYLIYRKIEYNDFEEPIGFIDVYHYPDELVDWLGEYLNSGIIILAVTPEARGTGLGYKLSKEMVNYFTSRDTGLNYLYWSVSSYNIASKKIAERLGFKKIGQDGDLDKYIFNLNKK